MHRRKLREAIHRYSTLYPEEQSTSCRFLALLDGFPTCFERTCWDGHITGSAWLVDPTGKQLLLTNHRKLKMWLQLGGHSDGDANTSRVAYREAVEESGLNVEVLSEEIFDIDIHEIPAAKHDPAHYHFDVRYQLRAKSTDFVISEESLDLAWVPIDDLEKYTKEISILRMRDKWRNSYVKKM
jgi:8-oxo-dGTP pyrophosphatase MutT (NUDIX family)